MDYVTLQECIRQQSVHSMDKEDDNSITSSEQFPLWTMDTAAEDEWNISSKSNGTFMNFKLDTGRQAGVGPETQILSWR